MYPHLKNMLKDFLSNNEDFFIKNISLNDLLVPFESSINQPIRDIKL